MSIEQQHDNINQKAKVPQIELLIVQKRGMLCQAMNGKRVS